MHGEELLREEASPSSQIPHQAQQVLISWVFITASVTLWLDFGSLQQLVHNIEDGVLENSDFVKLNNWFGVVSCVCWLLGFAILLHWLYRVQATTGSLAGAWLKLLASVLFNLQPMTGTTGYAEGAGWWWSNVVGILFFHVGNVVSCTDMRLNTPPGASRQKGWLYHGNLPILGMWLYQLATWCLVWANIRSLNWGGKSPPDQWAKTTDADVAITQNLGAALLLAGSLVYLVWCGGHRGCAL